MRTLSATECISPAIERTKLVLFAPFRKGRTWKLCATAALCRYGTLFFPFPIIYLFFIPAAAHTGTWAVVLLIAAVVFFTLLFAFLFYVFSRLQFAYFDIVLNRGEFVAPAWRRYGLQSGAWTGVKVLFGIAVTLAFAAPLAAFLPKLAPLLHALTITPGQAPPPEFLRTIGAVYAAEGVFLLVFGLLYLFSSQLADFVLPSLALEDTGIAEAFRRMFVLVRQEPGEFALYTLLKVVLGFAAYMGIVLAWEIAFVVVTLLVGGIVAVIGYALHLAGISWVILTMLGILVGIAWYLFAMYTIVFAIGPVLTFLDAYALFFLGGRYPLLGELLDRSTPQVVPITRE